MESCIYGGWVRHRRFTPVEHSFRYSIGLIYLDLSELDEVFRGRLLWSCRRPAVARFHRGDHLGEADQPLDGAVRDLVADSGRPRPAGPIRLLTHLRYFGFVFNPVSFYFCHDAAHQLAALVAEVNNTPWGERHYYVLDPDQFAHGQDGHLLQKQFHVSPFMPMDIQYRWRLTPPGESLAVHLENVREGRVFFDVAMQLRRRPITAANLARMLMQYPLMTQRVVAAIYWQALRLWWKGCPFFAHPRHSAPAASVEPHRRLPSSARRRGATAVRRNSSQAH